MGPPVSESAMVFIVLKTICAPRALMNGRKVFLWRSESQHWPGSCSNLRNKVNAGEKGGEGGAWENGVMMIDCHSLHTF